MGSVLGVSSPGPRCPRSFEFLFSRNRFNAAVSRARFLALLVCSSEQLHVRRCSAEQMKLVNALCLLVERAGGTRRGCQRPTFEMEDARGHEPCGARAGRSGLSPNATPSTRTSGRSPAGGGALESGARQPLIPGAEALGAPLATTAGARDLFAGHPADLCRHGVVNPTGIAEDLWREVVGTGAQAAGSVRDWGMRSLRTAESALGWRPGAHGPRAVAPASTTRRRST